MRQQDRTVAWRERSWSHGLAWRERADEDQPTAQAVRTDQRLDRRGWLRVGRFELRRLTARGITSLRRRPRLERFSGDGSGLAEVQIRPDDGGWVAMRRI